LSDRQAQTQYTMHDINDNSTASNNNDYDYDYNKCCRTRSEYNDRLISLLNRNKELEDKLQNEQRTNQRYLIKTNVQNILIKELMNNIQSPIYGDIRDKNKNNVLLLIKNAKQVAELSMEIEQMKQQQTEKEQQQESLGPNLNYQDGKDVDDNDNDNGNDQSLSFSSSDKSNNDNELVFLLEKERTDYFENKCESLERSVNTFKCKNSEREIRNSISLRNMRNQIVSLEKQLKRISIVLQLQENGNDENKNKNKNDEKERMNQLEVQNIKLKLKLTEYRRRHEKQLQQQQQQQHQHQHEREKNYQTSKTSSTHHHDTIFRGMDDDDDQREEANEEVVFLSSSSSSSKVHYLSYCDGNTISNNSNSYREEVMVDDDLDVHPTQRKPTNNSITRIDTTSNESLESLESLSSMIQPLLIALSEDDDDDNDESSSSTFSSSSSSLGVSLSH
jgi:hypothetical protein